MVSPLCVVATVPFSPRLANLDRLLLLSTTRAWNLDLDSQLVVDASVPSAAIPESIPLWLPRYLRHPPNMVVKLFKAVLGAYYLDSSMAGAGQFFG